MQYMNRIITLSGSESPESARRKQRKYERSSLHLPITSACFLRNLKMAPVKMCIIVKDIQ